MDLPTFMSLTHSCAQLIADYQGEFSFLDELAIELKQLGLKSDIDYRYYLRLVHCRLVSASLLSSNFSKRSAALRNQIVSYLV